MANPTIKVPSTRKPYTNTRNKWFFVGGATNTRNYQNGQMVGTYPMGNSKAGYVTDFDDSAPKVFLGILDMPAAFAQVLSTTADNVIEAFIDTPQWMNFPLNTGSASRATSIGAPVYAYDAGHVTLTPTSTTNQNLAGWVIDVDSGAGYPQVLTGPNVWFVPAYGNYAGPTYKVVPQTFEKFRYPANFGLPLPATTGASYLGLIEGTFLTANPTLQTPNNHETTATNGTRFEYVVPFSYVYGSVIYVAVNAGMLGAVADTSAVVQVDVARVAAPTVNIGPGSAGTQSINSLTAATKVFALTSTNILPGDILDIRIETTIVDGATSGSVAAEINSVAMIATY